MVSLNETPIHIFIITATSFLGLADELTKVKIISKEELELLSYWQLSFRTSFRGVISPILSVL
jgi:hypothetical protein